MKKLFSIFISFLFILISIIFTNEKNSTERIFNQLEETGDCQDVKYELPQSNLITRNWYNYNSNSYCMGYSTSIFDYRTARKNRTDYTDYVSWDATDFWGKLYENLYEKDKGTYNLLLDSLRGIKEDQNLDRNAFANLLVSFVQDIPYSYVLGG